MQIYRLKEKYPNSPEIGYVINGMRSEYYQYNPHLYPLLWDCFESDTQILSSDGVLLNIGDKFYIIQERHKVQERILDSRDILPDTTLEMYSTYEYANNKIIDNISVVIENETIIGEDIKLYGVCIAHKSWDLSETTSLKLSIKAGSINWKWFRTEKERDGFIKYNKPSYSLNDLIEYGIDVQCLTID